MKKISYIVLLFFLGWTGTAQVPVDSISYNYYFREELKEITQLKKQQKQKAFDALKQIKIADLYSDINCEDSAYATYYKVFEKEQQKKTLSLENYNQLLYKLQRTESAKHNYTKKRFYFLQLLEKNSKNSPDSVKWKALIVREKTRPFTQDSTLYHKIKPLLEEMKQTTYYKTNKEFKAKQINGEGSLLVGLKKYSLADEKFKECIAFAQKNNILYQEVYATFNLGLSQNLQKNYKQALVYLDRAFALPYKKYRIKIDRGIYKQKQIAYEKLNDTIQAKKCANYYKKLDSLVNDFQKNSNFYEIDIAYQVKEKDKKIAKFSNIESRFKKNKIIYGILLFLVFLLALYSFIRWKKVDLKKKKIAQEKAILKAEKTKLVKEKETLTRETNKTKTELEKIKQLVKKDHILLNGNTKIYFDKLIYVKVEGHYLSLHTQNKKEFIRGKLKNILSQLPPNFAQSHRSFIVNKNYVTYLSKDKLTLSNNEIVPVSRNYKVNFMKNTKKWVKE